MTGVLWHAGYLYFTNTDRLSRLDADGTAGDEFRVQCAAECVAIWGYGLFAGVK